MYDSERLSRIAWSVSTDYGQRCILGLNYEETPNRPWHSMFSDAFEVVIESINMSKVVQMCIDTFPRELIRTLVNRCLRGSVRVDGTMSYFSRVIRLCKDWI